jgi:hypothetical protein
MTAPAKPKYRTINWKDYNAALKARGSLLIWLDKDMCWHGTARGKRGRVPKYSGAAVQFCLTIKGLFNLPLCQAMGMTQSLLELAKVDWRVPDFSTISRRQKQLSVAIGTQPTTTGLHLLVDSTGIKILGEREWKTKMHGADYRRQWLKVHLGIDAVTLEIWAIEVTDNATGDAPILPCLLDQLPAEEMIASVSGDGVYDTKGCHEAIAQRGARAILRARTASHGRTSVLGPKPAIPTDLCNKASLQDQANAELEKERRKEAPCLHQAVPQVVISNAVYKSQRFPLPGVSITTERQFVPR